jgi:hypothetical protein
VVPGNASGSMEGIALKPLTVSFHEYGFNAKLNSENQFSPYFMLSDKERRQLGNPMEPGNPQALNRYSYVQNNPLKYTDPSGHTVRMSPGAAARFSADIRSKAKAIEDFARIIPAIGDTATILSVAAGLVMSGALPAAVLGVIGLLTTGQLVNFLNNIAEDLKAFADVIDDVNALDPNGGVTITAECAGRLFNCRVTVINTGTGTGKVVETGSGLAAKGVWNALFEVNGILNPNNRSPFEPGVEYEWQ